MKTRFTKNILTLLMLWVVMPVMAQDYMTICLKNGEKRRIPLKNIIEIISSKKDEHGQIYNDYQFLHVTTKYNSYFYRIEDVDSISYRKVIESEVDANTASCYNTVFPILNNNVKN